MTHAFITVGVPFLAGREARVNALLDRLGKREGRGKFADLPRPAGLDARARSSLRRFVHFLSMTAFPEDGGVSAFLVIEVCADGRPDDLLARLVGAMAGTLREVVRETGNQAPASDAELVAYLEAHRVEGGTRLFSTPGLVFTGTPEMTVTRIRGERLLALRLRRILERQKDPPDSALQRLRYARKKIFRNVNLKWAFASEPVPLLGPVRPKFDLYRYLAFAALRDYLWVLAPLPLLVGLYSAWFLCSGLDVAFGHFMIALVAEVMVVAAALVAGYLMLLRQEKNDVPYDVEPEKRRIADIMSRENLPGVAQNHLAGISILKPGLVRRVSLRFALWVIAEFRRASSRPGFLDRIGTIHFARWLLLPGTDRLVFLSNFDGSWQSYLEDFIARLREGLTSVWSNTRDFPKTAYLFIGGASDGARFKRWARRQQVATRFWYSAYPQLTTDRIRANAAIRHGFASASNEAQAAQWLALFGYVTPENVEKDEVSALAFSGLSDFRHARCLILHFGEKGQARAWVSRVRPALCYGEHAVLQSHALVAAFTSNGLRKLELKETALATFPTAFQEGMSAPQRARALGDEATVNWKWGGEGKYPGVDAALILYAKSEKELNEQIEERELQLKEHGHQVLWRVHLQDLPRKDRKTGALEIHEPFGFRDGLSQPIMRGSKRWSSAENAIHVVEPGELLLGYRDNLGNVSPSPSSNGEDIGRNGTFLVIRQLEQSRTKFDTYCEEQAKKLEGDPRVRGLSGADLEHWVAATMVGRWRDGSSLVRNPHPPPAAPKRVPDNDFRFGREDPDGLRCPLGAHIRRANPRDSLEPGSQVQLEISNRHRILRVGRVYQDEAGAAAGLLFMCVNADIERQFEFLQQTWILGSNFHGLDDEIDPIVGYRGEDDTMTVPTARGPVRMQGLAKFVTVLGGGYFFIPGKRAVRVLVGDAP